MLVLIYFSVKLTLIPQKYVNFLLAVLGHHKRLRRRLLFWSIWVEFRGGIVLQEVLTYREI